MLQAKKLITSFLNSYIIVYQCFMLFRFFKIFFNFAKKRFNYFYFYIYTVILSCKHKPASHTNKWAKSTQNGSD
jgi:hypothetical protein